MDHYDGGRLPVGGLTERNSERGNCRKMAPDLTIDGVVCRDLIGVARSSAIVKQGIIVPPQRIVCVHRAALLRRGQGLGIGFLEYFPATPWCAVTR